MKKISALFLGIVLTTSALAQVQYSPYLSISGGGSALKDSELSEGGSSGGEVEYDASAIIEGAVGVKIDPGADIFPFRAELAGFYQQSDVKSVTVLGVPQTAAGEVTLSTLILNGYVDMPVGYGFAPYIFGGFGYAFANLDDGTTSENNNLFCGQVGAGLGYSVTDHIIIDLRYKYFMSQKASIENGSVRAEIAANQLLLGLRYEF